MSYESTIYIVEKTEQFDTETRKRWAQTIAVFDIACYANLSNKMRNMPVTDCYVYADDGDTMILEDCYGKPLTEASVPFVIEALEKDIANGEIYRRIFPLLAALKALNEHKEQWRDLVVLHFGH